MNILVTGANGQLGTEIRNLSEGMGHRFIFSDVNAVPGRETVYLDITNLDAIRIVCRSEAVDVIVNCAAYTDVEKAVFLDGRIYWLGQSWTDRPDLRSGLYAVDPDTGRQETLIEQGALFASGLEVMDRDTKKQRGDKPYVFTDLYRGIGLDEVIRWIREDMLFEDMQ